jgi:cytochrome c oxidase subunit 3
MAESRIQKQANPEPWLTRRREPLAFMLKLGVLASALVFAFILMAYLVRQSGKDWVDVSLPRVFWASTAVMVVSSFTFHAARRALRHERFLHYRLLLSTTFGLGLTFISLQLLGWRDMMVEGVVLSRNAAGAFIYLLSGLHIAHVLGGLVVMGVLLVEALRRRSYVDAFVYSVNPPKQLQVRLAALYWHFVDVLWLGLFLFLLYHHQR